MKYEPIRREIDFALIREVIDGLSIGDVLNGRLRVPLRSVSNGAALGSSPVQYTDVAV